ncbi:MAG: cadherin-like beta sandwich domain-containing protein [Clostridia bacterium]|nr:cadherin-like beta sandwich domain-containing protein [Clostridia bacterium]
MKKSIKIILGFALILALLVSIFSFGASAAQALLSFDKSSYTLGQTVRMTVKYNANSPIYANEIDVVFNNSVLKVASVNGGEYTVGTSSIKIVDDDLSTATAVHTSGTYTVTFTAVGVGTSNISVSVISDGGNAGASGSVNVALSGNANLGSLKVSGGTLSPAFNPNTTNYIATVKHNVDKATLSAGVADGNSTVVGAGTFDLAIGDNVKTVTVTAANGTKKSYTVNIKRLTEEETKALEEQERANDAFLITFEGKDYHIIQDISTLTVPGGFTASTTVHRENEIGILVDAAGEYTLFYATADEDETKTPLLFYKSGENDFKLLPGVISAGNLYILEEPVVNFTVGEGYFEKSISVGSLSVSAYGFTDTRLSDFYIVYAYFGGERGFYRYDTTNSVIQRAPDFVVEVNEDEGKTERVNIFTNFSQLKTTAKIIVLLIAISILCIIALIVLFVIKITSYNKELPEEETVAFDEVTESDTAVAEEVIDLDSVTEEETEE